MVYYNTLISDHGKTNIHGFYLRLAGVFTAIKWDVWKLSRGIFNGKSTFLHISNKMESADPG